MSGSSLADLSGLNELGKLISKIYRHFKQNKTIKWGRLRANYQSPIANSRPPP